MSLIVVGLNHKTAPVAVRERLAFTREEAGQVAAALRAAPGMEESILLSTCNRTEVVAATRNGCEPEAALGQIRDLLGSTRAVDPAELAGYLYSHHELDAVRHVFRVACSLDSMVVGEPQILGQVKEAYNVAAQAGSLGPRLEGLLQRAFAVAKRVRTATQISRNPVSIAYAAAELAARIFGSLEGRAVMLLGAGKMGDLAARHLLSGGAGLLYVASRSISHAQQVAVQHGGIAVTFDRFKENLKLVDIVVSSTAAPGFILFKEDGIRLMKERRGRPIFFIDIAVPRDIDPELNTLDNLYLYNIDDLQALVDAGVEERRREAVHAEEIVEEEVAHFHMRTRARAAGPTIVELREKLHALAAGELRRFRSGLGPLSDAQERELGAMMSSFVNKVLHGPTRELKRGGHQEGRGDTIDLVRRMFDLKEGGGDEQDDGEPRP